LHHPHEAFVYGFALDGWGLRRPRCPHIPPFAPFAGWDPARSTQSLFWYNAYNAVKHDRETNFAEAKFIYMVHALGAVNVMLLAQFGSWWIPDARTSSATPIFMQSLAFQDLDFRITKEPSWPPTEEYLNPRATRAPWSPKPFPFQ